MKNIPATIVLFMLISLTLAEDVGYDQNILRGMNWLIKSKIEIYDLYETWGPNDQTASVLETLIEFDFEPKDLINKTAQGLIKRQNEDGGWAKVKGKSDTLVTAQVLMALLKSGKEDSDAVKKGIEYLKSKQNPDGSFEGEEGLKTGITANSVLALIEAGEKDTEYVRKGIEWLKRNQKEDGSWEDCPKCNNMALRALLAYGEPRDSETIKKAVNYIISDQNPNGSWGNCPHCTGMTMVTLLELGETAPVEKAVKYLLYTQQDDGSWKGTAYYTSAALLGLKKARDYNIQVRYSINETLRKKQIEISKEIISKIPCGCGCGRLSSECDCEWVQFLKADINQMLMEGKTKEEILSKYSNGNNLNENTIKKNFNDKEVRQRQEELNSPESNESKKDKFLYLIIGFLSASLFFSLIYLYDARKKLKKEEK
ncbi:MAG: prenyltransferase/squalene oxidase repeat-containing protein [Candidatus Hydrothermarchaeota archaeon]